MLVEADHGSRNWDCKRYTNAALWHADPCVRELQQIHLGYRHHKKGICFLLLYSFAISCLHFGVFNLLITMLLYWRQWKVVSWMVGNDFQSPQVFRPILDPLCPHGLATALQRLLTIILEPTRVSLPMVVTSTWGKGAFRWVMSFRNNQANLIS
jgi:hypothetical protein